MLTLVRFASVKLQLRFNISLYKCKKSHLYMKYELNYTVVFLALILGQTFAIPNEYSL